MGVLRASQRGFMVNGEGKLSAGTVQILAGIQASARGFFILSAHQPASSGCASERPEICRSISRFPYHL